MWNANNQNKLTFFILCFGLDIAHLLADSHSYNDNDWDFFVFAQYWPMSYCKTWIHDNPTGGCNFPNERNKWNVHGLWPSKRGTLGPMNCNTTWLFDPEQIRGIEDELEQKWSSIRQGAMYDFWAHKWNKHGTCAATIEPMNSELKYFTKTLELFKNYSMTEILTESNIYPSDTTPVTLNQLNVAVVTKLGVRPLIKCEDVDNEQYLLELRLCLNKEIELIDCDVLLDAKGKVMEVQGVLTAECSIDKDIFYRNQELPERQVLCVEQFCPCYTSTLPASFE